MFDDHFIIVKSKNKLHKLLITHASGFIIVLYDRMYTYECFIILFEMYTAFLSINYSF